MTARLIVRFAGPHVTVQDGGRPGLARFGVPASGAMDRLALAAAEYARREGFAQNGYRIVMNCNGDAGQTVFQIHLHLLAGAPLGRFGTPH